jgi:hypothetical protein
MMVRFAFNRLIPLLTALLCVGLAMIVLDIALRTALGPVPAWLPAKFYGYLDELGSRIAKVEQLERQGKVDPQRLVVVIGGSAVRADLDPRTLEANDPLHRQWLILGGAGSTFLNLETQTRVFVDSSLKPGLIILGVHEKMLHRKDRRVHTSRAALFVADHSWLYDNREDLQAFTAIVLNRAANFQRRIFNLPMSAIYTPERDPWTADSTYASRRHDESSSVEFEWRGLHGDFQLDQYESNDDEFEAFRRMVDELRAHGSRLVLVLMPEPARARSDQPPIVARQFEAAVASVAPLEVIDLRASGPEDLYFDPSHLNSEGRTRFSTELPRIIP